MSISQSTLDVRVEVSEKNRASFSRRTRASCFFVQLTIILEVPKLSDE